ncbi:hypothetical protein D3C77_498560 [compost metagenome]
MELSYALALFLWNRLKPMPPMVLSYCVKLYRISIAHYHQCILIITVASREPFIIYGIKVTTILDSHSIAIIVPTALDGSKHTKIHYVH